MSDNNLTDPNEASPPREKRAGGRKPTDRRVRFVALLWQLLGVALISGGVMGTLTVFAGRVLLKDRFGDLFNNIAVAFFTGLACTASSAGVVCFNHGKKLKAVSARELISKDARPPVLYLRSFKDDPVGAKTEQTGLFGAQFNVETEEQRLAKAVGDIGPFIAVGRPGENLPELGAARIYFADDEWEEGVTALMSRARLVVLRAGQTDGVWWEVRRAVETLSPERLLLLIPYNKSQYEVFREEARQYLLHELPEYKGAARLLNASIKGYIYFGPDWVPHFVKLKAPLTRAIGYGGELERKLRSSLRPVFKQLNVRWTPPRFKWARSGLVVGGVLVAVLSSALILHLLTKPATPSEAAYARALEHLRWNPELNKASGNLSPQGAGQAVAELAARGYPRLDDSTLLLRATLLRRMLAAADVLTCDSMARGQVSAAQLNAVLKKLEPSEIEAFFSVMEKAALAELREAPPPKYSEREVADAFDSLRSKMSYSEADRVPCLAARRLYDNLVTLKEPHRGIVLHSLAAGRTE